MDDTVQDATSEPASDAHVIAPDVPAATSEPTLTWQDLALGVAILGVLLVALPRAIAATADTSLLIYFVIPVSLLGQAWMLAFPLWIMRRRGMRSPLRVESAGQVVANAALAIPLAIAVLLCVYAASLVLGRNPVQRTDLQEFATQAEGTSMLAGLAILAVFVAPIAEETFFRGFLYAGLKKRRGPVVALVVQGLIFALGHDIAPAAVAGFFLLAAALAGIYEWRKTLYASIATHFVINALGVIGLYAVLHAPALGVSVDDGPDGLVVTHVAEDSAADRAGLREGDVLLTVAGEEVGSLFELQVQIRTHRIGDEIAIEYLRDGERHSTLAVLQARRR